MKIDQTTKIGTLIKENPEVIEAIVSINKHFEKLRNPILRKILASRVTIADAAKIGGVTVQDFYDKLVPLGFYGPVAESVKGSDKTAVPEFYREMSRKQTEELDVTPDIETGKDPFNKIMDVLAQMPSDHVLKLTNSFEPIPLINLLEKKGYESYVLHKGPGVVQTFLKRKAGAGKKQGVTAAFAETDPAEMTRIIDSYGENSKCIDVRELEMPMPMLTIMKELEGLAPGILLNVTHRRIPVHLFPELEAKGFTYYANQMSDNKVIILIHK